MKRLVILGAGTGGTTMANHLKKELDDKNWGITIVDGRKQHYYQPGFLFIPFDQYKPEEVVKPIQQFIPKGVDFVNIAVEKINAAEHQIVLASGNTLLHPLKK